MRDWADTRYWILGADTPLGAALADRLSRAGVSLVLSGADQDKLENLMIALPGKADYIPVQVADATAMAQAGIELGQIDGLVFVAATANPQGKAADLIGNNLTGAHHAVEIALPQFRIKNSGHIVLLGGLSGPFGFSGSGVFASVAAGLRSLAESLRQDLRKTKIHVQAVSVGEPSGAFSISDEVAASAAFEHMCTDRFRRNAPVLGGLVSGITRILPDWLAILLIARLRKEAQN